MGGSPECFRRGSPGFTREICAAAWRNTNGAQSMNISNGLKSACGSAVLRFALSAIAVLWASVATAANPFNIEGVVPDAGASSFPDPSGSEKELGPVNASNTKLGIIHTALPSMLEFTNPNSSTDLSQI